MLVNKPRGVSVGEDYTFEKYGSELSEERAIAKKMSFVGGVGLEGSRL